MKVTSFPRDWFWLADDGKVYSSATQSVISKTATAYKTFTDGGDKPTRWPEDADGKQTEASLLEVIGVYGLAISPVAALLAYAATARYNKEVGGITVNGMHVSTDRESQSMLSGAFAYLQANTSATISWKTDDNEFVTLDLAAITLLANAVAAHVQSCFATEASVVAAISANPPTINDAAAIDAAFAG